MSRADEADVRVRDYAPADLEACLSVFDSNVPDYFVEAERSEFRDFLGALPGPYVVLELEGRIVACGGHAFGEEGVADLCWGMVRRDRHRSGLGRLLTEARIERAVRDPRVNTVALNTSQHTEGFYLGLGFETVEVRRDGFAPGLDCLVMRRPVDAA